MTTTGDPSRSESRTHAAGGRSNAAGTNSGTLNSGDHAHFDQRQITLPAVALKSPADVDAPVRTHNLPALDSTVFEGRQDHLDRLAALPATGTGLITQTLHGLGGIGKSTLALHHALNTLNDRALTWWITADSPESTTAGLANLACRLNPALTTAASTDDAADWAIAWLQTHTRWLLILDNVEQPPILRALLGQLTTGQTLITTRRNLGPHRPDTHIQLGILNEAAAVTVLIELTGQNDPASHQVAALLAKELGHLPLALQQAGAYIAQTQITLTAYLHRLRQQPARLHAHTPQGGDPQRTIARIWSITLDTINQNNPHAVELLQLLAYYAPEDVPRDILTPALHDPLDTDHALTLLHSYSLITLTPTTITTHRLLQSVLRANHTATEEAPDNPPPALLHAFDLMLWAIPAGTPQEPDNWPRWRTLLPHFETLFTHLDTNYHGHALAHALGETALFLSTQGQASQGLPWEQRALTITEATLGPHHTDTALRLGNLAATHSSLGQYTKALPLTQRALAITETRLGLHHRATAICLGNLASIHSYLGQYTDALPLEQRALAITEAALGPHHPTTALRLGNLAGTHSNLGQHTDALPLEQRALAITETTLGPHHPTTALRLGNLAATFNYLDRHSDALPLSRRALAITEAALGPQHPEAALRLGNLAATFNYLGHPTDALPLEQRALAITEATLGPHHPDTVTRIGNLAATYSHLGQRTDALALNQRALAISEAGLGADHPTTRSYARLVKLLEDDDH